MNPKISPESRYYLELWCNILQIFLNSNWQSKRQVGVDLPWVASFQFSNLRFPKAWGISHSVRQLQRANIKSLLAVSLYPTQFCTIRKFLFALLLFWRTLKNRFLISRTAYEPKYLERDILYLKHCEYSLFVNHSDFYQQATLSPKYIQIQTRFEKRPVCLTNPKLIIGRTSTKIAWSDCAGCVYCYGICSRHLGTGYIHTTVELFDNFARTGSKML